MEIPTWVELALTILGTFVASSGCWAFMQERERRRCNKNDQKTLETDLLIGLAHDRIISLGMSYIERGYVTQDEYENLYNYLYKPYKKLNGNGSGDRVMAEVNKLPIRNGQQ